MINKTLQLFSKQYTTRRALMDTTNAVLTTQLINIRQNHGELLLNVRKRWGENSKRILLNIFLSPGEMQFWQPSQKTFGQKLKRSAQCRNKKTKGFHRNVFLLNLFPCATGKQFLQPCRRVCHKLPMIFCRTSENFQHFIYKMLLWTRRRQFWQPHQKNFRQKAENNSIEVRKKLIEAFFKN